MTVQRRSAKGLRRSPLLLMWAFWALIAALRFASALTTSMLTYGNRMPAMAPASAALIDCLLWALLTPLIFRLTHRLRFDSRRWLRSTLIVLTLGLFLALAVSVLMTYLRRQLLGALIVGDIASALDTISMADLWSNYWYVSEFSAYMMIVAAAFAYYYLVRYNISGRQAARLRVELVHAKLDALRSQLNPHFLFNTLNTISALIELNPDGARLMVTQLSELLRDTLDGGAPEVSLRRELSLVRRYIAIMQTRFEDRLAITEDIQAETLAAMVPQLILQPLVENAIKHGVERLAGTGQIRITAKRDADGLILSVTDNGPTDAAGATDHPTAGTGLGLANTSARLQQCYAERQSLTVKRLGGETVVEIVLPFHLESALTGALS